MYGFIYLTKNKKNDKRYIGKRVRQNDSHDNDYLGSGTLLKKAIEKYGRDNFERIILKECLSKEELEEFEKYYIKKFDAVNNNMFYNLAEGGSGGNTRIGKSELELLEWHSKIASSNTGKIKTDLEKSKARERMLGENNPMYGLKGDKNPLYDKPKKEESIQKMREAKIGVSPTMVQITFPTGKVEVFNSQKECYETLGISQKTLRKYANSDEPFKSHLKSQKHLEGIKICFFEGRLK